MTKEEIVSMLKDNTPTHCWQYINQLAEQRAEGLPPIGKVIDALREYERLYEEGGLQATDGGELVSAHTDAERALNELLPAMNNGE